MTALAFSSGKLRPVEPRTDLAKIADLIEICFSDQLDEEGRNYVRNLRRYAAQPRYIRWIQASNERLAAPLDGYVWEIDGKVVGNLSLIPFRRDTDWIYLIANVAVHPDYRRHGIGRLLTVHAVSHIRRHGAAAWLQVNPDNRPAVELYQSIGFVERSRRTTWLKTDHTRQSPPAGIQITQRRRSDWPLQQQWLDATYPEQLRWNLFLSLERQRPNLWNEIVRFFSAEHIEHWEARIDSRPVGFATWEAGYNRLDSYWLAVEPEQEDAAILALLLNFRNYVISPRPININYPTGRGEQGFRAAGFTPLNTLIWMEAPNKR
jgi:ribosomal protein S18 acetylase RimI-like enzyme